MTNRLFHKLFGNNEDGFSKAIGFTLSIHQELLENILKEALNNIHYFGEIRKLINGSVVNIDFEKHLFSDGRIDIALELDTGLIIGIENKKWAELQSNQLQRYANALHKTDKPFVLLVLTPKEYTIASEDYPKCSKNGVFSHITYPLIYDECIKIKSNSKDMQEIYFDALTKYFEEIVMKPFDIEQINSLKNRYELWNKVKSILNEVNNLYNEIYNSKGTYIEENKSYSLSCKIIKGNVCFYGFRYNNNWYYDDLLLNDGPEVLFYIKDTIEDGNEAKVQNDRLKVLFHELKDSKELNEIGILNYYERKSNNECRLALRKSLYDFKDKNPDFIVEWILNAVKLFESKL